MGCSTVVSGELLTRIQGRELDDEVYAEMRYANGARGRLWAGQVAPGFENDLRLRIVGSRGTICFRQQLPGIMEGLSGMRFIENLRASSDQGGVWMDW